MIRSDWTAKPGLDEGVVRPAGFFEGTGMPDPGWWEALWPDPRKVLMDTGLTSGMNAVDVCSGDGWFTLQIAELAREVVAIDIDPALLNLARAWLAERGASNCIFVEDDAYNLATILSDPADYVFLANALHGVPDKARLAGAVREVLQPNGLFVVVNWDALPQEETVVLGQPRGPATALRMSRDETVDVVESAGLKRVSTVAVSPYHYGIIFKRG